MECKAICRLLRLLRILIKDVGVGTKNFRGLYLRLCLS